MVGFHLPKGFFVSGNHGRQTAGTHTSDSLQGKTLVYGSVAGPDLQQGCQFVEVVFSAPDIAGCSQTTADRMPSSGGYIKKRIKCYHAPHLAERDPQTHGDRILNGLGDISQNFLYFLKDWNQCAGFEPIAVDNGFNRCQVLSGENFRGFRVAVCFSCIQHVETSLVGNGYGDQRVDLNGTGYDNKNRLRYQWAGNNIFFERYGTMIKPNGVFAVGLIEFRVVNAG
jgi:hypothetical protein